MEQVKQRPKARFMVVVVLVTGIRRTVRRFMLVIVFEIVNMPDVGRGSRLGLVVARDGGQEADDAGHHQADCHASHGEGQVCNQLHPQRAVGLVDMNLMALVMNVVFVAFRV
jgi:hypothetical protein